MKPRAYYINLAHRTERKERMEKEWSSITDIQRIDAIDMRETREGVKGCFLSHTKVMDILYLHNEPISLIMEDDVVPCKDFNDRLDLFLKELPEDWDIFMLGFSSHNSSRMTKISNHIYQANSWVGAGHCYIINPRFYMAMDKIVKTVHHEFNLDVLLNYLQQNHKVYLAVPTFCYQYSSFSDNSNMVVGNTIYTEKYYRDSL